MDKRKTLIKFKKNQGFPDGITLDNNNGLWVAHWAGGQLSRIDLNSKKIDFNIKLPALNITSVTFVGKKLNHLFITTAKLETSKTQLKSYKYSGSSFIIKTSSYFEISILKNLLLNLFILFKSSFNTLILSLFLDKLIILAFSLAYANANDFPNPDESPVIKTFLFANIY